MTIATRAGTGEANLGIWQVDHGFPGFDDGSFEVKVDDVGVGRTGRLEALTSVVEGNRPMDD